MIRSFIVCICMLVVSLQHTDGLIIEFQSSVLNQMLQYFKKPPEPVTLYVNIHSKNRMLACGPTELMNNSSQSNLYKWTRANGEEVPVSDSVSVSNNAELVFHRFLPEYSGEYHCNRVYSLGGFKLQKKFNSFVVYGFHEPSWNLNTWLDFISQGCDQTSNTALAHSVLNKLKTLLSSIGWEIDEKTTACSISINNTSSPNLGIVHMEFTVYPNITWENVCIAESTDKKDCDEVAEKSMEKAYTQMDDFFKNNKEFNDEVVGTFKMQLINNSVAIYKIQLCHPGFGQDDGVKECQNCCEIFDFS
ncbi:zona pellucida-binding protein 2-like [Erpetoichthys calabaricus]|uniref:zona pellucida-binding protein 2-like n=1 Tax=Erpetoichthys calabaricus TaxID=27687 RepID=UPI0022341745|nr:zona pellucida-binding protein 2-like [Erpetoichthys calabaricus]